jgi:hypothetical protein
MWALLVALQISRRYSDSFHVAWSIFGVTVARASVMRDLRCLKVVDLNLVDNVLRITSQEKIQWG